jgi:hypothetical protein
MLWVGGPAFAIPTFVLDNGAGRYNAYALESSAMTWDEARVAANATTMFGLTGHLATITSATENASVNSVGSGDRWVGLTDATAVSSLDGFDPATTLGAAEFGDTSGQAYPPGGDRGEGFVWVTGESTAYRNWGTNEPNDSGGNEDAAHIRSDGFWNDHRVGSTLGNAPDHDLQSVVEFDTQFPSAIPPAFTPGMNVVERRSTGTVNSVASAFALLALASGDSGIAAEHVYYNDRVNYLDSGGDGRFTTNNTAPLTGGDNYVIEATGYVEIPAAGDWTFGTNTDDGSWFRVRDFIKSDDVLAGAHDDLATFTFPAAGFYDFRLVFFEAGGGSEVELFAAQGAFNAWGDTTTWQLVGDTANGGLLAVTSLPEPGTLALLGLGGLMAARRRRRRT